MSDRLKGVRVAFVTANEGVEQVEFEQPWEALRAAGAETVLIAPESGDVQMMNHLDKAERVPVDRSVQLASPRDFDAVVLPGGVANPDQLRLDRHAVDFIVSMFAEGKPVAAICHAPWTLVEGDLVRGRTVTSWPSLRTDIGNAGGIWVDDEVVVCTSGPNTLVTSRKPEDLEAFCARVIEEFAGAASMTSA